MHQGPGVKPRGQTRVPHCEASSARLATRAPRSRSRPGCTPGPRLWFQKGLRRSSTFTLNAVGVAAPAPASLQGARGGGIETRGDVCTHHGADTGGEAAGAAMVERGWVGGTDGAALVTSGAVRGALSYVEMGPCVGGAPRHAPSDTPVPSGEGDAADPTAAPKTLLNARGGCPDP
ncbi:unnamed protein product [Lampetra planeri]